MSVISEYLLCCQFHFLFKGQKGYYVLVQQSITNVGFSEPTSTHSFPFGNSIRMLQVLQIHIFTKLNIVYQKQAHKGWKKASNINTVRFNFVTEIECGLIVHSKYPGYSFFNKKGKKKRYKKRDTPYTPHQLTCPESSSSPPFSELLSA